MSDYLSSLPPKDVQGWYRRLAAMFGKTSIYGAKPLSSVFLNWWLDNGAQQENKKMFVFPHYMQSSSYIRDALYYHRKVFLSEWKRKVTGAGHLLGTPFQYYDTDYVWGGVIKHIQDKKWTNLKVSHEMEITSLIVVGGDDKEIERIQKSPQTPQNLVEKDMFFSLRGFNIRSKVLVSAQQIPNSKLLRIFFNYWKSQILDKYDFDGAEYITLPNPDYQVTASYAIAPNERQLTVYHSNAERLIANRLAKNYEIESEYWDVRDATITSFSDIDPAKKLQ